MEWRINISLIILIFLCGIININTTYRNFPLSQKKFRTNRVGEKEEKNVSHCNCEGEWDENTIILFPKKEVKISKEDSMKTAENIKKITEYQIQQYKPFVEEKIKFLEENFDKGLLTPRRTDPIPLNIWVLERAGDKRALPVLSKVALYNSKISNRMAAIHAIGCIERHNKDTLFIFVLRKALEDSGKEVQLEGAEQLIRLDKEDEQVISILEEIAKGINEENWIIDEAYSIGTWEYLSREEREKCRRCLTRNLRRRAIIALGYLSVKKGNEKCRRIIENLSEISEIRKKFLLELEYIKHGYTLF